MFTTRRRKRRRRRRRRRRSLFVFIGYWGVLGAGLLPDQKREPGTMYVALNSPRPCVGNALNQALRAAATTITIKLN
jgi:hypothetical protein